MGMALRAPMRVLCLLLWGVVMAQAAGSAGHAKALGPSGITDAFKRWQADADSKRTDKELSVLREVSSRMRQSVTHKQGRLQRAKTEVGTLSENVKDRQEEEQENLTDAREAERVARENAERATHAITEEKYRRVPLTDKQKREVQEGTHMYLDAQEGIKADHERARRIAELEADVAASLHKYKTGSSDEELMPPFSNERQGKSRLRSEQSKFKRVANHQEEAQRKKVEQLQQQFDALKPQMVALNEDEHVSRMLDLQYDIVNKKLTQLKMLNKYGGARSVEQEQGKIDRIGVEGSSETGSQLKTLASKLKATAEGVEQQELNPNAAAELHTAESILDAASPDQLKLK